MSKIHAEIVADSLNPRGDRLTSVIVTLPRIILSEMNTHRMLSKNTSSSRAIPFEKMVKVIEKNPFIPIAWQKHHKGMQGTEYLTDKDDIDSARSIWLMARNDALSSAKALYNGSLVTKQLCNRLLEPFMWTTMLVTGSKDGWDNFFELRCPKYGDSAYGEDKCSVILKSKKEYADYFNIDIGYQTEGQWQSHNYSQAEVHIQKVAEEIYDAFAMSEPARLQYGDWHIPFESKLDANKLEDLLNGPFKAQYIRRDGDVLQAKIELSTALAARVSYTSVGDDRDLDYQNLLELHDRLIKYKHDSPLEHCAQAMLGEEYSTFVRGTVPSFLQNGLTSIPLNAQGWCKNFKGFKQYRYFVENKLRLS